MVDKFDELSDVLDETRKTFSETVSNLDSKFSEELANQDERTAVENAHFSDLCKNLDHRMSEETVRVMMQCNRGRTRKPKSRKQTFLGQSGVGFFALTRV